MRNDSTENGLQSVERAIDVLEALSAAPEGLGALEVSRRCSLPQSTTHRLLQTLARRSLVRQGSDRRYHIALSPLALRMADAEVSGLRQAARGPMEWLRDQTQQSIHLGVLEGSEVVYVETLASPRNFAVNQQVGRRNSVHCTALGKAMLSRLPGAEVRQLLNAVDFVPRTSSTITEPAAFVDEVARAATAGVALDLEESEVGVRCIAAPLPVLAGSRVAALSVSGPTVQLPDEALRSYGPLVREAAALIASNLGSVIPGSQRVSSS
jgi:DNA-binding IclR family transcriptional regulator